MACTLNPWEVDVRSFGRGVRLVIRLERMHLVYRVMVGARCHLATADERRAHVRACELSQRRRTRRRW